MNNTLFGIYETDNEDALDCNVSKTQGITLHKARTQRQTSALIEPFETIEGFGTICTIHSSQNTGFNNGQKRLPYVSTCFLSP